MKKYLLITLVTIFITQPTIAQVPQGINYQGVVRDANGDPITNGTVEVRFSIRENTTGGTIRYRETHTLNSNAFGLIQTAIGTGTVVSGNFLNVDWGNHDYFLQVEAHTGTLPFVDLGTTQFLSVPYAQFAGSTSDATPSGSIIAYGGYTIPNGWLKCDGAEVSRTTYSDLFAALGISWGPGNGTSTFHLPDLRGQFLRGVDDGAGVDPDTASRFALNFLGNTGDAVGSYQIDTFETHNHTFTHRFNNAGGVAGGGNPWYEGTRTDPTSNTGGSETRPKNAYVYYIIKY